MKSLALKILALCVFDIKNDIVIKSICDIGLKDEASAFAAYGNICRELIARDCNLSEYLRDLLLRTSFTSGGLNENKYEYDFSIIIEISALGGTKIKNYLIEKFGGDAALSLPPFKSGSFDYDAVYFIDKIKLGTSDFAEYKAFISENGELKPVLCPDTVKLSDLKEYDAQKQQVVMNTEHFLNGKKAQNVLLYGDRGTGKSSTVKALINHYSDLKIIGLDKNEIKYIPKLFDKLRNEPFKLILFLDDLVFEAGDDNYSALKQILEGSLTVKPDNVLIYATTNRRHIIKETVSDRDRDAFHRGDALDDNVSLSDRFGLYITYSLPDKELYMRIVKELIGEMNINMPYELLEKRAEQFALKRGGRSPRIARKFTEIISSEIE